MKQNVLVIGYGNPLRRDDGAGQRTANLLRQFQWNCPVEILTIHQLTPELADPISRSGIVIFIDACVASSPGQWQKRELSLTQSDRSTFTHFFSPLALLVLAHELYGFAPPSYLYTIAGESFDHGETLSPIVEAVLDAIASDIQQTIHLFFEE